MKITIVVANPIIAALLGGISRQVLFDSRFSFATTSFTMTEVDKYVELIAEKSGLPESFIIDTLKLLPLKVYSQDKYLQKISEAKKMIGKYDTKDIDVLALALFLKCPLWSEDKHFQKVEGVIVVRTKDLI